MGTQKRCADQRGNQLAPPSPRFDTFDRHLRESTDVDTRVFQRLTQRGHRVSRRRSDAAKRDARAVARTLVRVREQRNQRRNGRRGIWTDRADRLGRPCPHTCVLVFERRIQCSKKWPDVHLWRRRLPPCSSHGTEGQCDIPPESDIGVGEATSQRRQRLVSRLPYLSINLTAPHFDRILAAVRPYCCGQRCWQGTELFHERVAYVLHEREDEEKRQHERLDPDQPVAVLVYARVARGARR